MTISCELTMRLSWSKHRTADVWLLLRHFLAATLRFLYIELGLHRLGYCRRLKPRIVGLINWKFCLWLTWSAGVQLRAVHWRAKICVGRMRSQRHLGWGHNSKSESSAASLLRKTSETIQCTGAPADEWIRPMLRPIVSSPLNDSVFY